jgi:hypothetical protein
MIMRSFFTSIILMFIPFTSFAGTWCTFNNFDVSVAGGKYVAVRAKSLDAERRHVYLGDLTTEKGRSIQALLMAASIAGKNVRYGHNGQDYLCGSLPTYSNLTVNPEYIEMLVGQ